jgi:hypothetical protein
MRLSGYGLLVVNIRQSQLIAWSSKEALDPTSGH